MCLDRNVLCSFHANVDKYYVRVLGFWLNSASLANIELALLAEQILPKGEKVCGHVVCRKGDVNWRRWRTMETRRQNVCSSSLLRFLSMRCSFPQAEDCQVDQLIVFFKPKWVKIC